MMTKNAPVPIGCCTLTFTPLRQPKASGPEPPPKTSAPFWTPPTPTASSWYQGHPGYTSFFSDYGDVAPAWKLLDFAENGGKLLVNLINTAEYYYDVYGSGAGELPPAYGLTIAAKADHAPASVTLQPEGRPAEWTNRDGYVHVKVPKLDIHTILVLE